LVLVPVWTRRRRDAVLVAGWLALNPVIFGKPAHNRAWATRAILGEELWVTNRPRDTAAIVTGVTSLAAVGAIVASALRRPVPAAVACITQMALTLVYWELMARYWDRYRMSAAASACSTGS
jgi:Na+-transporting NADH:ubiquinone oxidoreductase subunit NqrD